MSDRDDEEELEEEWRSYSDEEFETALRQMNGLVPNGDPWRQVRARKQHTDLFGKPIRPYEVYYGRRIVTGEGYTLKLTRASMERLFDAVLWDNWFVQRVSDRIREQRDEAEREEAQERLARFWSQFDRGQQDGNSTDQ